MPPGHLSNQVKQDHPTKTWGPKKNTNRGALIMRTPGIGSPIYRSSYRNIRQKDNATHEVLREPLARLGLSVGLEPWHVAAKGPPVLGASADGQDRL